MGNVCDRNFSPHPRTLLIFINIFVRCAMSSLFDIFHILISTKIKGKKNFMSQVFFIVLCSFLYYRHVSSNRFRWAATKIFTFILRPSALKTFVHAPQMLKVIALCLMRDANSELGWRRRAIEKGWSNTTELNGLTNIGSHGSREVRILWRSIIELKVQRSVCLFTSPKSP